VADELLPLLALFEELRTQADLPLGVDEYLQMVQALQAGFGLEDENDDLRKLCYLLWTNNRQEQKLLDYYFDLMLAQRRAEREKSQEVVESKTATAGSDIVEKKEPVPGPGGATAPPGPSETTAAGAEPPGAAPAATPAVKALDHLESAIARPDLHLDVVQAAHSMQATLQDNAFVFTGEYFPVTRRQMKQSWRHLRSLVRSGPRVVLNVPRTVQRIARDGLLIEPVLEPRRANRMELLLLVDRRGSMVPFHLLADRLVESAQKGGRLASSGVYYFYNVPQDRLYLTSALIKAESLRDIFSRLHKERTVALIFSDAGAARGRTSDERVATTGVFLKQLNGFVRRVAWINPMPEDRWAGTSAELIKASVPMFPFSRRGLYRAIDLLRGRSVSQYSTQGARS
jgi:uncharacterized protein with von Willebrand factor type A (vWA) domain